MQFVSPMPFWDALDKLGSKSIVASTLNSEQWANIPVGLRDRAFFSATIEDTRFLQAARDFLNDYLANNRTWVGPSGDIGTGKIALAAGSRAQFVKDLSDFAVAHGMGPLDPEDAGSLKDISSQTRLSLIFNTQTQALQDYGYWKQGMDPDLLNSFPAQRFIRVQDVKTPRIIHQENENVVELKTNLDFWLGMNSPAIGGFGVPWGPWGFNSGMGTEDVDREESESMHLVEPGQTLEPIDRDVNDHLEASTQGLDPDMIEHLKESFGDQVEIDGDTVRWAEHLPEPATTPEPAPVPSPEPDASPVETFEALLERLGVSAKSPVTLDDVRNLLSEAKEVSPVKIDDVVDKIVGAKKTGVLAKTAVQDVVQEFLDYLPPSVATSLPKLTVKIVEMSDALGEYAAGTVRLSSTYLADDPQAFKKTAFHELMHWFHMEGSQAFRDAIAKHFAERTAGESLVKLPGYSGVGKLDKWYESYAGKIYPWEMKPAGLEMPTRYIEMLAKDPQRLVELWNSNPSFRETFLIVLKGFFQ